MIKRAQHNTMPAVDQAHGRQELEHQRPRPMLLVPEAERDRVYGVPVADDHVKSVLMIHDRAQTPHTLVHVVGRLADPVAIHALASVLLQPRVPSL